MRIYVLAAVLAVVIVGGIPWTASLPVAGHPSGTAAPGPFSEEPSLSRAIASLSTGAGPAAGAAVTCTATSPNGAVRGAAGPIRPVPLASSGDYWTNLTSDIIGNPGIRTLGTMVYDYADGYVVLFGGDNLATSSDTYGDTWTYQYGVWTDISGAQVNGSPPSRYAAGMAYDDAMQAVVLFGGEYVTTSGSGYLNDTWSFSKGQWTDLTATAGNAPSARWRVNLAYDAADGYLLMFGGTPSNGTAMGDSWKFQNGTWSKLTVTGSPPGRYRAEMAYDASDQEVVIFGGCTTSNCPDSTTWVYSNLSWSLIPSTTHPSGRVYFQMESDPSHDGVLLFGGSPQSSAGVPMDDTWIFSKNIWTNVTANVTGAPAKRGYGMMAYDPIGNYTLLNGGYNNAYSFDDSWALGSSLLAWPTFAPNPIDVTQTALIAVQSITKATNLTYNYSGLPPGCVNANVSELNCTPTAPGSFVVFADVSDASGDSSVQNATLVVNPLPTVQSIQFTPPAVDTGFTTHIHASVSGGTGAYSFAWPQLPTGCTSSDSSTISCTPRSAGTFPTKVVVGDQAGGQGNLTANLVVNPSPAILNFLAAPATFDEGQSTHLYANVSGGTAPFTYAWTHLPPGCSAQDVNPLPCQPLIVGTTVVNVNVTDTFGLAVSGQLSVVVNSLPTFGPTASAISPSTTDSGVKVSLYVNATGGTTPYAYRYTGLPAGCVLANSPRPSCIPHDNGTFSVVVNVTDAAGKSIVQTLPLTLLADPSISALSVTPGAMDLGTELTVSTDAVNGSGTYT
ncbi:MAG TPA: kelch repeat-containing protein, partial [Thermoplasmata archaeon]|nr:kelch repeat-containing protein [Thermoplasmata archaeon]